MNKMFQQPQAAYGFAAAAAERSPERDMRIVMAIALLVSSTGCMSIKCDRSGNSELWKPFEGKQRYALTEDVFLMSLNAKRTALALVPSNQSRQAAANCYQRSGYYSAPDSIQAYQISSQSTNWADVVGVIQAGTLIETCKLDRKYQFSLWFGFERATTRHGKLLSGSFAGTVVNIEDLHWNVVKYLKRD